MFQSFQTFHRFAPFQLFKQAETGEDFGCTQIASMNNGEALAGCSKDPEARRARNRRAEEYL
jgi:hypothetical protein